jgi:leader peptidase (prepilin peptidase)/N-methyltransferase
MSAETVVVAIVGSLIGAASGSTAGVALIRWRDGGSLLRPRRSACSSCGKVVAPRDNIPLVSYVVLRGRCRHCGAAIDPRLLVLEAACAGMGALVMVVARTPAVALALGITGCALILATATDVERRIIPDRLSIPLAVTVLPLALHAEAAGLGSDVAGFGSAAGSILPAALGIPGLLVVMNVIGRRIGGSAIVGGGDAKLLVGVGAAVALLPSGVGLLWVGAVMSGGATAAVGVLTGRLGMKDRIAFAPFLLVGFVGAIIAAHVRLDPLGGSL